MTEYLVYMRHRVQPKMQTLRVEANSYYEASLIARERALGHTVTRICPITAEFDD
jgi:hypothetical protein